MSFTTGFRQPEYIGENRCFPCTLLNVGIAAVVSIVVGLWMAGAGAAVFLLSLGSIYFRGYLVPGTPTLTKAYLPDRVLLWFGKDQQRSSTDAEFRLDEILSNTGAIGPCERDDDLCLQPEFRTAWHDRIETVQNPPSTTRATRNCYQQRQYRIDVRRGRPRCSCNR
jgi:hypothetical protein